MIVSECSMMGLTDCVRLSDCSVDLLAEAVSRHKGPGVSQVSSDVWK